MNQENASHPAEHYPVYRAFLMRSLDRCDTELAALVELNRSLHDAKKAILETCGEATLLDIGQGLVKLKDDQDALQGKIPPQGQEICVDFLLRMKLRRKLLNRLSRRLGRLSHAMDGEDIQPPSPPKYGDLRLYMDPNAIKVFEERWKRQDHAMKLLQMRHESYIPPPPLEPEQEETKDSEQANEEPAEEKSEQSEENKATDEQVTAPAEKEADAEMSDATAEKKLEAKQSEASKTVEKSGEDVEMSETKSDEKEEKSDEKPEETVQQGAESAKSSEKADETKSSAVEKPAADETTSGTPTTTVADNNKVASISLTEEDYIASLRDFDEAYTKEILPSTGTVKYPILGKNGGQDDHNFIKYGAGIGASHRTMSAKDKELEFKRWQAAILQRIPDQPTFEELGLANRVFFLEERRKRLAEEPNMPSKKKKQSKKEEEDSDSDSESEDSDDDEKMSDANDEDDEEEEDTEMEDKDDDTESRSENVEKVEPVPVKPVKPISLVAVPSFHEQDQKRLRMIHADLMATSIHEHARVRVGEATAGYNDAYNRSRALFARRTALQTDLNQVSYESRAKVAGLRNSYLVEVAAARKIWEERHREKALASLPSNQGITPSGTPRTASAANHPDHRLSNAGKALADIVDCVVARSESGWKDDDPIEDFQPPPEPDYSITVLDKTTGETLRQRQERLEGEIRQQLTEVASQIHGAEEERKKAWKKLLKTKSDFDMPHSQVTNIGGRNSRVSFNPNQLALLPVPSIHGSGSAMMPALMHNYPMASIPSYVPPVVAMPPAAAMMPSQAQRAKQSASESKYSAANIRARKSADGSIAPATEPKRDSNGLYIRPPGRGRIGMDWDAVRGLWIPLRDGARDSE